MTRQILLALALLAVPAPAFAQQDINSGDYMLLACSENSGVWEQAYCLGTIRGFDNGFSMAKPASNPTGFCVPDGVSIRQKRDVLLNYLQSHPERRHVFWSLLYLHAQSIAWPCSDGWSIRWLPDQQTIELKRGG